MIKDYIKNIEFNLFKLFKKERALSVAEFNVKIDQFKIYTYKFLHIFIVFRQMDTPFCLLNSFILYFN